MLAGVKSIKFDNSVCPFIGIDTMTDHELDDDAKPEQKGQIQIVVMIYCPNSGLGNQNEKFRNSLHCKHESSLDSHGFDVVEAKLKFQY